MSLPTNRIKKVKLPNTNVYEVVPERLQKNGYEAALPDLTADSTIALASDLKNQKVKAGSVTFGDNDIVNIKGDGIVSVTGNNASGAKDITISASHQSIKTLKTNNSTTLAVSDSEAIAGSGTINLHKVSKTGSYNDLLNKPTIPAAQIQSDYAQTNSSALDYIKNKPDLANYVTKDDPYLVAVDNTYSYWYRAPVVRDSTNHAISLMPVRLEQHHNLSNSIPIQVGDVWPMGRISIKVPESDSNGEVPSLDTLFTDLTYSETFGGMPACSLIKAYNETYSTTTMPLFVVNLTSQNLGYVLGTSLPVIGAVPLYATASGSLGGITWVKGYQNISSNFTFNYFTDDGGETITYVYNNYLLKTAYINRVYSASLSSTMREDGIIALTSDLHTHANKTALDGFAVTSTSVTDGSNTFSVTLGTNHSDAAYGDHVHGNVLNNGTITSTAVTSATGVLVYDSNNKIQRATAANARTIIGAGTYSKPSGGIPDSDIANASTWNNKAAGDHTHGNITNDGKITATAVTTGQAGIVVVDSNGNISKMTDAASARTLIGAGTSNLTLGTSGTTAAYGNHTHSEYIAKTLTSTKGDIIYASAANTPARLGIGTEGQVLKVSSSGIPAWSTDNAGVTSVTITTSGTGISINNSSAITTTGSRVITLNSSAAGNAATSTVVLRSAAGQLNSVKYAVTDTGTNTVKATIQYNNTSESLDFVF